MRALDLPHDLRIALRLAPPASCVAVDRLRRRRHDQAALPVRQRAGREDRDPLRPVLGRRAGQHRRGRSTCSNTSWATASTPSRSTRSPPGTRSARAGSTRSWRTGATRTRRQRYVKDKKTITPGGDLGVTGHIGWFVPTYFAKQHPDVTDWKNLNKYADQFRTAESGGKGQLLDGSPSYVTNDKALVKNLKLDYQVVFSGSEAAQITQIKQFAKEKKPFLTYWYKPQWLFEKVPMTEMKLPRVQGRLRRRRREGRLRLSAHAAAEVPQRATSPENGGKAAAVPEELHLDAPRSRTRWL